MCTQETCVQPEDRSEALLRESSVGSLPGCSPGAKNSCADTLLRAVASTPSWRTHVPARRPCCGAASSTILAVGHHWGASEPPEQVLLHRPARSSSVCTLQCLGRRSLRPRGRSRGRGTVRLLSPRGLPQEVGWPCK